jgi:hypothetical protein
MKVIVRTSGFYGGTWYEAGATPVDMPYKIAKQFLPPYGDQLVAHVAAAQKMVGKAAAGEKSGDKRAH